MTLKRIAPVEAFFHGHISLKKVVSGWEPWRLPYKSEAFFPSPDDALVGRSRMSAGVRVRLTTRSTAAGIDVAPENASRQFDLVVDNDILSTFNLPAGESRILFENLPARKPVEIWLSPCYPTVVRSLLVEKPYNAAPAPDKRPKWVTYGSSITHCIAANSPARTWPGVVARNMNWNLTCLGYNGQCHMDPMVARMIRDLPADFISLKVGINIYGNGSLNPRSFAPALIGLIQIIREKHPRTPITIVSPIISPEREETPNAAGLNLSQIREIVGKTTAMMISAGDKHLSYVNGLNIFGPALVNHLPDLLHPDGGGYEILGRNFLKKVARRVELKPRRK